MALLEKVNQIVKLISTVSEDNDHKIISAIKTVIQHMLATRKRLPLSHAVIMPAARARLPDSGLFVAWVMELF